MSDQPPEIATADPALADGDLRRAPLTVRKAGAWLEQQKPHEFRRKLVTWGSIGLLFGAFPVAGIVATLAHSENIGAAAMVACFGVAFVSMYTSWRSWGRTAGWANDIVHRWKKLQEIGGDADLAPDGEPATTALQRMLARIEALAGPGRELIRDAAVRAVERAHRLEA